MKVKGDFNSDFNKDFLISKDATMTREQIAELIEKNVKGQYNQLDIAGTLPDILNALLGAAPMEVEDITKLTNDQLDALDAGSIVAKITGTAKHLYIVSYKDAENGGLCLTYTDASTVETVSYDHGESGWTYNSTDVTHIGG